MLESALRPEWDGAVRVGVASHNLFDVAWALVHARPPAGGATHAGRIGDAGGHGAGAELARCEGWPASLLLYAPVVQHDQIDASIAYLARRLDENTAPENFLRALFTITPGSAEFVDQAERFRMLGRRQAPHPNGSSPLRRAAPPTTAFTNEPDSDPTDPDVRRAAAGRRAKRLRRVASRCCRQRRRDRRDRADSGRRAAEMVRQPASRRGAKLLHAVVDVFAANVSTRSR